MQVASLDELKKAAQAFEPEIVVTDESLAKKVLTWNALRTTANVLVIVVLAIAIFTWANPLRMPELEQTVWLLARRIALGFGILLLFAEYVIPIVRLYKPADKDALGLKLVPRKPR
jgi:hypothetical protein